MSDKFIVIGEDFCSVSASFEYFDLGCVRPMINLFTYVVGF